MRQRETILHTHTHIQRVCEREKDRETNTHTHTHTRAHRVCERETERERYRVERREPPSAGREPRVSTKMSALDAASPTACHFAKVNSPANSSTYPSLLLI